SAEGVRFLGHVEATFDEGGSLSLLKVTRWSLWLGTAMLVASGLTSFAMSWRQVMRAISKGIQTIRGGNKDNRSLDVLARLEVPFSWFMIGMVPITIGLVVVCWLSFGIAPWLGLLSVALSFVLGLVACRATGETDTTPIGAMGKITQFTYAVLAPKDITVNLMTAGVTAGAAGSSADLLTDLKSGYLLGANPRQQFLAQLFGVFFGVPAVIIAWYLLVPDKAHLEAFNSPATGMWAAVAKALATGVETIPETARLSIVYGALLGVVLALVEGLAPRHWRWLVPSSMGLGLAFVVPFQNSLSFFIGALLALFWQRFHPESSSRYLIPIASGVVAGESLLAAGSAMWNAMKDLLLGGGP
ncbi:MAG: OPT/YSL family transporter, partial [Sandaracinaceae bacterium]|nr:OPT/YSL family transporter [Sandaracinaceae bacterium]